MISQAQEPFKNQDIILIIKVLVKIGDEELLEPEKRQYRKTQPKSHFADQKINNLESKSA